jgi:PAS domain S-box-containing protein
VIDDGARSAPGDSERAWVLDAVAGFSDGLIVIDQRARLVYQNPAASSLLGADAMGASANSWPVAQGLFLPDEQTPFALEDLPLVRSLRGEEVRDAGMFVRSEIVPSGLHLLVSASPLRDREGNIRGAACIFRDISSLREKEAMLREGARQKKAILDNIPDMAWLKDEQGAFLLVNQPFAEAMGRKDPDDLVGLTDHDLLPKEVADRYRADDERVMASELHLRIEEPFVDPAGRRRWIETIKTRIVDDQGRAIGITGIARDVTERKAAEEHMRTTRDQLEARVAERTAALAVAQENLVRQERLAVLGQLAGGVAHQIRNPLAAIMNASYVLKRHLMPDQHQNVDDAIRIIHDEVRHANTIITGLLDYARVRTPDRHPVSLADLLDRCLKVDWIPPSIRIIRELPPPGSMVCSVDADQLQSAVANLIRNAVDAMPGGGDLRVDLIPDDGQACVVIRVTDNGPGIAPQVRRHLFEPLHSSKPMGIGLGLVTARRLVEAHGGKIACIEVEKGARFEIVLPLI